MAITERPSLAAMETPAREPLQDSAALLLFPSTLPPKFLPYNSAALIPILGSCYFKPYYSGGRGALVSPSMMRMGALFSSSSSSSTQPAAEVQNFKLPPPVNPPDPENPDRATLRAQWDHAVRLYGRMYSHAWGTAILAGVSLFGIGWWIKGENPLKALSPTGELKKEETSD